MFVLQHVRLILIC